MKLESRSPPNTEVSIKMTQNPPATDAKLPNVLMIVDEQQNLGTFISPARQNSIPLLMMTNTSPRLTCEWKPDWRHLAAALFCPYNDVNMAMTDRALFTTVEEIDATENLNEENGNTICKKLVKN